jgi:hypothetical protein
MIMTQSPNYEFFNLDALRHAWQNSKAKGSSLLVLLALARHTNRDTGLAFPSVKTLTQLTGLCERTVRQSLKQLRDSGEIIHVGNIRGVNKYRLKANHAIIAAPKSFNAEFGEAKACKLFSPLRYNSQPTSVDIAPVPLQTLHTEQRNGNKRKEVIKGNDIDCPDISQSGHESAEDQIVCLQFPVKGNDSGLWDFKASHKSSLEDSFPDIDIMGEAKKARGWLEANPERRKTARGMPRFLFSWIERSNNGGRASFHSKKPRIQRGPDYYDQGPLL